jgi:hypothetical protein
LAGLGDRTGCLPRLIGQGLGAILASLAQILPKGLDLASTAARRGFNAERYAQI